MKIYAIKVFENPYYIKRFEFRNNKPEPKPANINKGKKINKFV